MGKSRRSIYKEATKKFWEIMNTFTTLTMVTVLQVYTLSKFIVTHFKYMPIIVNYSSINLLKKKSTQIPRSLHLYHHRWFKFVPTLQQKGASLFSGSEKTVSGLGEHAQLKMRILEI